MDMIHDPVIERLQRRYTAAKTAKNQAEGEAHFATMALRRAVAYGDLAGRVTAARAGLEATVRQDEAEREIADILAEIEAMIAVDVAVSHAA